MFPVRLEGERLTLREFTRADLPTVTALERAEGGIFAMYGSVHDEETAAAWWRWIEDGQNASPRTEYRFAVEMRGDGELIGIARVCIDWPRERKGSIGYAFARSTWGKGLGTEAATMVTGFGFDSLGMHRIEATIEPDNERSQRVATKLGMQYEGRIRDYFLFGDEFRDALLYSVLEGEWTSP